MRVFLTGGSGYIGRATIDALLAGGHEVRALARSEGAAHAVRERGASAVVGGLADRGVLCEGAEGADAVIHLAQAASAEEDLAAAEAMIEGGGLYVHTGGTWVYGDTGGIVDETAPWNPPALVAWRRPVEDAVRGRGGVIIQPGLVYGGENRLIRTFLGSSYIGDGANSWALIHVEDVAALYVAALGAKPGSVYIGVGGVGPTAAQVAAAIGDPVSITYEQARETMGPLADAFVLDQRFSTERARRDLGWEPAHRDPLAVLGGE